MFTRSIRLACLALLLFGLLWPSAGEAAPRRRYRGGASLTRQRLASAAQAQLQAGEQLLAAANSKSSSAQSEINTALGKLRSAKEELEHAQDQIHDLAKQLHEIEQEILDGQQSNSPYRKAKAALDLARQELLARENHLLVQAGYDERKAAARNADEVSKLRTEILQGDAAYLAAKAHTDAAAKEVSRLRLDLFHADKDWKEITDALADAHRNEDAAHNGANSAGASRRAPQQDFRDASQAAAYANTLIAQAKTTLAQLGVKSNPPNSSKSKSSPGKQ